MRVASGAVADIQDLRGVAAGHAAMLDMTEDAIVLFNQESCLAETLERLRGWLQKLGARRMCRGNTWYWDLKPDYKWGNTIELF